ncbi:PREDICTED: early activation antigen CD69 [Chrysochloris asiatica]|uniref:Early activation antigen CD69 n=1 Tax=Chrysochloris asiatica TaxID=185453 RepID=A0A9B0U1Z8_CHRAS|nr:PREDICTED: early activation antigen CD69 [Chrysochloris asiatica]
MNSEDCSMTENSSSHLETGKQSNDTSSHFATHHEGSLQVPIPCAVMSVAFITILIIALIALSVGQYNCPGQFIASVSSDSHAPPCSDDWVVYQRKCYHFSTRRNNWTLAQTFCSKHGATLALMDSEKEMIFLKRYMGSTEHWIGLTNETSQTQKLFNGNKFNNWLKLTESDNCPFLNITDVSSIACQKHLHWICSKPFN